MCHSFCSLPAMDAAEDGRLSGCKRRIFVWTHFRCPLGVTRQQDIHKKVYIQLNNYMSGSLFMSGWTDVCTDWRLQVPTPAWMEVCRDGSVGSSFGLISDVLLGSLDKQSSSKKVYIQINNHMYTILAHCLCLHGLMSARTGVCRYPRLHGWKSVGIEASDLCLGSFQMSSWGYSTTEQP